MSAASGSQTKGEASKKYKALNINNLFKGKSIETASKTVIAKHGMQSLGKVGAVRRIPPPANLPSLKAENCGNDPNINLVPAGGQGWGNKAEETTSGVPNSSDALAPLSAESQMGGAGLTLNADLANATQTTQDSCSNASVPAAQPLTDSKANATISNTSIQQSTSPCTAAASSTNSTSSSAIIISDNSSNAINNSKAVAKGGKIPPSSATSSGVGVTAPQVPIQKSGVTTVPTMPWSSGTGSMGGAPPTQTPPLDGGPPPASSVQQSPFFHREFPTLGGGSSLGESTPQYGPGPSLRPETKGSWALGGGRGVAQPQPDDRSSSSPHTSSAGFNGEMAHASRPGNLGSRVSPPLGVSMGPGGGPGLSTMLPGPPNSMPGAGIPGYLGPMGHPVPPHQFRGAPYMRGGGNMQRPPGYIPSGRPPFPGRYRSSGNHPPSDDEPIVVPPPIIKKEDLDEFEPVPPESDGWANSAVDVDYNKKLNFSEDEASTEDDRSGWRSERGKEKRESREDSERSTTSKAADSADRGGHGRGEKASEERKLPDEKRDRFDRAFEDRKVGEEKRDRYDRSFPPTDVGGGVPPRWQQPPRGGFEQTQRNDYARKSASPASGFEDDGWKRREMVEVQAALERARLLEQEEEKRYEEKKRFDQSKLTMKRGRDGGGRDYSESSETDAGDQFPPSGGRDRDGRGTGSGGQDGNNREREPPWDAHPESGHDKGREYRGYGDRRDMPHREGGFRDQYDGGRPYDRRDREQQPVFSSTFKSKLPPRFQKQQQQQQQQGPPHRGPLSHQPPPPLFDPRYTQPYRHAGGRDDNSKGRRPGNEDSTADGSDDRPSTKSWATSGSGWGIDDRDDQWSSQQYSERSDRTDSRLRDEYLDKNDREGHYWNSYDRREFADKERDGRTRPSSEKHDYEHNRRRLDDRGGWGDDKKRFESSRTRGGDTSHSEWTDGGESKAADWRHEPRPLVDLDTKAPPGGGDSGRRNLGKEWEKEEEPRERPQRPDSRDSRGSRDSRTSRDSIGSLNQREKKLEMTSWADSTSEFDDYYRPELRDDHGRGDSLLKDFTLHESPMRSQDAQNSNTTSLNHDASSYEEIGSLEAPKETFRSGLAPAPITKERLEASESEKEVRKNMTTLRRSNQEPPRRNASSRGEATTTPTTTSSSSNVPHEGRHQSNNSAWSNSKPKNGDRSRPDSSSGTTAPPLTFSTSNSTITSTSTTTSIPTNSTTNSSSTSTSTSNNSSSSSSPNETGTTNTTGLSGSSSSNGGSLRGEKGTMATGANNKNSISINQQQSSSSVIVPNNNNNKKETEENVWRSRQQTEKEEHPSQASSPPAEASSSLQGSPALSGELGGTTEKRPGAVGSKNQPEASTPQTINNKQQQQKTVQQLLLSKDDSSAASTKKGADGRTPTTPAQGSSSTVSAATEGNNHNNIGDPAKVDKPPRDNRDKGGGSKVGGGGGQQKGGGRGGANRYDSAPPRGGRGGRAASGSYSLYRGGRGSRGDYRRGGGGRGGNPPRFQNNRNMRPDDYYFYDYPPQRKDGSLGDQGRYGAGSGGGGSSHWGRSGGGDRRGRSQGGRSSNASEVPSLMEADLRKQPNMRFDRMPPRFLRQREQQEQQQQNLSTKKERVPGVGGSLTNGLPVEKAPLLSQPGVKVKESSPEVTEDNDWETASENSDPDRQKDGKDKSSRDRKYGGAKLEKKGGVSGGPSGTSGNGVSSSVCPWQQQGISTPSKGGASVGGSSGKDTTKAHSSSGSSRSFDARKHPAAAKPEKKGGAATAKGKNGEHVTSDGSEGKAGVVVANMQQQHLQGSDKAKLMKQEKINPIERIDLSNYAHVSVIDNQPQVSEIIDDLFDSNSGFQEVTRKKGGREKHRSQDERANGSVSPTGQDIASAGAPSSTGGSSAAKKQEKKKKNKNSGFERSRQNKLPPRFAKKRENNRIKETGDFNSNSFFKDTIVAPPPTKNAWEKPLTATLRTNSPQQTMVQDVVINSNMEMAQENHDSGVEVSDPPNSTGSSQRSSPSDNPVFSRQDKGPANISSARPDKTISSSALSFPRVDKSVLDGSSVPSQTIIFENTNFKAAGTVTVGAEYKAKFGNEPPKPQRQQNRDRKSHSPDDGLGNREELEKREKPEPIELPLNFSKPDENAADMKLDFTFDQELAELSSDKSNRPSVSLARSSLALSSPASPSTHVLDMKIASVKKVWDTMTPLPEHPEDPVSSSTFSSTNFSGVVDKVSGLDHTPVLEQSFSSKETVGVEESAAEVGYQTGSPMQQVSGMTAAAAVAMVYTSSAAASLNKAEVSRSGNVCKVKPQQQATCNNTSISPGLSGNSISPPLPSVGHSSNMYLGGTPAFGGIGGAIPSPSTVMFNSSQQLSQTGLFQPLFDGATVVGQRGASQFSQYPYSIGQGLGSNAFGQQSMFLQTPPPLSAPADPYTNSLSQYRLQPNAVTGFGQSQPPQPQSQNTVLISSASTTLMSSAVKPSTHTFGSSQQNFGTIGSKTGTPFQQSGIGGALQGGALQGGALQGAPQHSVFIFDPSHSMGLLNSQLVQRPGVQSSVIQAIQTPSSFYSNNGAGTPGGPPTAPPGGPTGPQPAAAGYYTASGSPLQAAVQQQAQPPLQTPPAFSLQGFGNQSGPGSVGVQNFSSGINLTTQQIAAQAFRNNQAGMPASFLKSLQPGCTMPDVTRQQIKSPSSAHNSFASSYFPNASASSGAAMGHCSGNNLASSGHNTNIPSNGNVGSINMNTGLTNNTSSGSNGGNNSGGNGQTSSQMASPKSQNRKIGGQPVNTSTQRSGGYNPQVQGQINGGGGGGLRTNMVIGMRSQLGMTGPSSLAGGPMTSGPPQRYAGPGPIQRPPSSQNAVGSGGGSGGSAPSSNPAHRPNRGHPHQPPASLHPSTQQRSSNPSSAQQAKLRADALSTTQAFFGRDGTKSEKKLDGKASPTDGKESSASNAEAISSSSAPSSQQAADISK